MRIFSCALVIFIISAMPVAARPTVFWSSERVEPGKVVLLYGGDLRGVNAVTVWWLEDDEPGSPPQGLRDTTQDHSEVKGKGGQVVKVAPLQASDHSLKFVLPENLAKGIFAVDFGDRQRLVNVPKVEWGQPRQLLPGLSDNEIAPGSEVQLIGRNFLLDEGDVGKVRVALRGRDGHQVELGIVKAEKYSILAALPQHLPLDQYDVWVHNGHGGPMGWGSGLILTVKQPTPWPSTIFNIKDFGANGDNVTDDSEAFGKALAVAEANNGGVILFPHGTYRLTGWFRIPKRVVLRGESKDTTWLKWPQVAPKAVTDFLPAVFYGVGEYGFEHLSIMVRNARSVIHDLSFDVVSGGTSPIPAVKPFLSRAHEARDVFLRDIRIHYLPYSGRASADPTADPQWKLDKWDLAGSPNEGLTVGVGGAVNVEVSDCELVGVRHRLLDLRNARVVNNTFSNQMGRSWTDLGGQHVVFEGNRIIGASSWRSPLLPLRHLYIAHNTSVNIARGEREALTFDINDLLAKHRAVPPIQAWQGRVASAAAQTLSLQEAVLQPAAYRGFDALILDGTGAGQYRTVDDNTEAAVTVSQPWDVQPDNTSIVLVYRLFGHVIFYRNLAEDTSVLGQMWGHLYDAIFDSNEVRRSQGMWGLAGWFVQWLDNRLEVAVTYHVGPAGSWAERTPDGNAPFGYVGFTIAGRLTDPKRIPMRFPYVSGAVIRGNHLSHGHRVLVMWGYGGERKSAGFVAARDIVIDRNQIDHTPVGIELDANVEGAVIGHNTFKDVQEPLRLHDPEQVRVLE